MDVPGGGQVRVPRHPVQDLGRGGSRARAHHGRRGALGASVRVPGAVRRRARGQDVRPPGVRHRGPEAVAGGRPSGLQGAARQPRLGHEPDDRVGDPGGSRVQQGPRGAAPRRRHLAARPWRARLGGLPTARDRPARAGGADGRPHGPRSLFATGDIPAGKFCRVAVVARSRLPPPLPSRSWSRGSRGACRPPPRCPSAPQPPRPRSSPKAGRRP